MIFLIELIGGLVQGLAHSGILSRSGSSDDDEEKGEGLTNARSRREGLEKLSAETIARALAVTQDPITKKTVTPAEQASALANPRLPPNVVGEAFVQWAPGEWTEGKQQKQQEVFKQLPPARQAAVLSSPAIQAKPQAKKVLYNSLDAQKKQQVRRLSTLKDYPIFKADFLSWSLDEQVATMVKGTRGGVLYKSNDGKQLFKDMLAERPTEAQSLFAQLPPEVAAELLKSLTIADRAKLASGALEKAIELDEEIRKIQAEIAELQPSEPGAVTESQEVKRPASVQVPESVAPPTPADVAPTPADSKAATPPGGEQKADAAASPKPKEEKKEEKIARLTAKVAELKATSAAKMKFATDMYKKLNGKEKRGVLLGMNQQGKNKLLSSMTPQEKRQLLNLLSPSWNPTKWWSDQRFKFFNDLGAEGQAQLCNDLLTDSKKNSAVYAEDFDLMRDLFINMPADQRGPFLRELLQPGADGVMLAKDLMKHNDLTYDDLKQIFATEGLSPDQVSVLFNSIPDEYHGQQALKAGAKTFLANASLSLQWAAAVKNSRIGSIPGVNFVVMMAAFALGLTAGILKSAYDLFKFVVSGEDLYNDKDRKLALLNEMPLENAAAAFEGMDPKDQKDVLADRLLKEERAKELFSVAVENAKDKSEGQNAGKLLEDVEEARDVLFARKRTMNLFNSLSPEDQAKAIHSLKENNKHELAINLVNSVPDPQQQVEIFKHLHQDDQAFVFNGLSTVSSDTAPKIAVLNGLSTDQQYELLTKKESNGRLCLSNTELARIFNDTSGIPPKPSLTNGNELFARLADKRPHDAIMVLNTSGDLGVDAIGNGKRMFNHLAQQNPKEAAKLLEDKQLQDTGKYVNALANKKDDHQTLRAVLKEIPESYPGVKSKSEVLDKLDFQTKYKLCEKEPLSYNKERLLKDEHSPFAPRPSAMRGSGRRDDVEMQLPPASGPARLSPASS